MIFRVHIEEFLADGIALGLDGAARRIALPPHSDATVLGTRVAESVHPGLPGVALGESL